MFTVSTALSNYCSPPWLLRHCFIWDLSHRQSLFITQRGTPRHNPGRQRGGGRQIAVTDPPRCSGRDRTTPPWVLQTPAAPRASPEPLGEQGRSQRHGGGTCHTHRHWEGLGNGAALGLELPLPNTEATAQHTGLGLWGLQLSQGVKRPPPPQNTGGKHHHHDHHHHHHHNQHHIIIITIISSLSPSYHRYHHHIIITIISSSP